MAKPKGPQKHFSMIRTFQVADFLTLANGFCGTAAVFQAMEFLMTQKAFHLYAAAALVPIALVLDFLDGHVARRRHQASLLGRELDSLADVISFGVAPASIAYAAGANTIADQIILIYFAACAVSRLARYNITAESLTGSEGKVKYFEGTPVPLNIIPLGLLALAFYLRDLYPVEIGGMDLHLVTLPFLIFGSTMISKTIHIPKP